MACGGLRNNLGALAAATMLFLSSLATAEGVPGKHRHGPNGMEGWTILYPVPDSDEGDQPGALVIARRGHVLHRFDGDPFVWTWQFQDGGRHVAYETGPFHGSMNCVLADAVSGKMIAQYDCFYELSPKAPAWVKALVAQDG